MGEEGDAHAHARTPVSAWLQKDLDAKRQKRAGGRLTPFRALLVFFPLIFITYSE